MEICNLLYFLRYGEDMENKKKLWGFEVIEKSLEFVLENFSY